VSSVFCFCICFILLLRGPVFLTRMGKVQIKQKNGNQCLLKELRHVPDMRKNIISTGQLASEGGISTFTDKAWKVT
jgi:hypothetical protein